MEGNPYSHGQSILFAEAGIKHALDGHDTCNMNLVYYFSGTLFKIYPY